MILKKMEKVLLAIVFCITAVFVAAPLSASASTSVWVPNAQLDYVPAREVRYDLKEREVKVTLVTEGFRDEYFMVDTWDTNATWLVYFTDGKHDYKLECHSPNETGFYTMADMKSQIGLYVGDGYLVYDCSYSVNGNELTWIATLPEDYYTDPINVNAVEFTGYYYPDEIMSNSDINSIYRWTIDDNGTATLRGRDGDIAYYWITEHKDQVKSIDVDVDWFPVRESLFFDFYNLETVRIKAGRTYGDSLAKMFSGCQKLREVDLSRLNTKGIKDMSEMFYQCMALTDLDVSGLDTSSVKSMEGMFEGCESLGSVDLSTFRTPNLENMSYMFFRCASLTNLDVSTFDTSKVTSMRLAFACGYADYNEETYEETWYSKLENINFGEMDTRNVVDASNLFQGCIALKHLDVSSFDTSNMQEMGNMFQECRSLKTLDVTHFNTSSATTMISMFYGCSSLESIDLSSFDTSNVTNVNYMFCDCNSLKSLDLSNFDFGKVTSTLGFFNMEYDNALQTIQTPKNLTVDCELPRGYGFWQNEGATGYVCCLPKNATSSQTLAFDQKTRAGDLLISKKSLTLFDTITIDFKLDKSLKNKYHDLYLIVLQGDDVTKLTNYTEDGDLLIFHYRVAPQTMNEEVEAIPCAVNAGGEDVIGAYFNYSVAEYCYNMLGKEEYQAAKYAKLRRLLVDILLYGDAAQIYDDYKTDELAGGNLTTEQLAMGTDVNENMSYENVKLADCDSVTGATAEITNATLHLEAAVNIQFKFTANNMEGLTLVVTDGTSVLGEYVPNPNDVDTQGRHFINFDGLNAGEMRKTVYATLMQGGERVSNTYRYSIESYAASMKGKYGTKLDNLLDAMMRYGDSARDFAGPVTK